MDFRGKDQPTNVLAFPTGDDSAFGPLAGAMIGDIVLGFETIAAEARARLILIDHHIAHLVVHGVLHLIGLDHQTDDEAGEMERMETSILSTMNIPDPHRRCDLIDQSSQMANGD